MRNTIICYTTILNEYSHLNQSKQENRKFTLEEQNLLTALKIEDWLLVVENFSGFKSAEATSRLLIYERSDIHLEIKSYEDDLPAIIVTTAQTSFGFLYGQFTESNYANLSIKFLGLHIESSL